MKPGTERESKGKSHSGELKNEFPELAQYLIDLLIRECVVFSDNNGTSWKWSARLFVAFYYPSGHKLTPLTSRGSFFFTPSPRRC